MYMTPTRGGGGGGGGGSGGGGTPGGGMMMHRKQIPDGPISVFTTLILETPGDQWQKRIAALRKLVDSIPEGSKYAVTAAWYNTPPLLRHLAVAIGDLLKDPRSTVVKRTCESLTRLFIKCQNDARYLFKDLMTVILSVHAQTVQVIRNAVQEMVMDSIPEVPCKMVMPLWMERLKVDKSRTVRDACALYLGQSLRCWTAEGYLTDEIWIQVGGTLLRSLRDPSPTVRGHAKAALEFMQKTQPMCWSQLVTDEESPAAKDPKLLRWLQSLGQEGGGAGDTEELSVASKFSYNSDSRYARQPRTSSSPAAAGRRIELDDADLDAALNIPMSINVTSSDNDNNNNINNVNNYIINGNGNFPRHRSGLGPPIRVSAPFQQIMESPPPSSSVITKQQQYLYQQSAILSASQAAAAAAAAAAAGMIGTPPRPPTSATAAAATPASSEKHKSPSTFLHTIEDRDHSDHSQHDYPPQEQQRQQRYQQQEEAQLHQQQSTELDSDSSFPPDLDSFQQKQQPKEIEINGQNHQIAESYSSDKEDENPFIASMQELKKHAAQRRSRNSILMKERFRMSGSNLGSAPTSAPSSVGGAGAVDMLDEMDGAGAETPLVDANHVAAEAQVDAAPPAASPKAATTAAPVTAPSQKAPPPQVVVSRSSSSVGGGSNGVGGFLSAPEHMVIAIRLLRAHKGHVDQIMETLKIEMDTLRDFDRLLEEPGRPLEEEVLDYFESVGLCLDQRTQAGLTLQREMDRISRGEPPQE